MVLASANRVFCRIALAFLIHSSVAATLPEASFGSLLNSSAAHFWILYI